MLSFIRLVDVRMHIFTPTPARDDGSGPTVAVKVADDLTVLKGLLIIGPR